nr:MAG TPA: hypothetical protein [Caudoviricetes sp.]
MGRYKGARRTGTHRRPRRDKHGYLSPRTARKHCPVRPRYDSSMPADMRWGSADIKVLCVAEVLSLEEQEASEQTPEARTMGYRTDDI